MSREELERFLTDSGRMVVQRFVQEASRESDDFDVSEALDRNLYDAMLYYDPRASLSRRLELRFTGRRTAGRMAEDAVEEILSAFRHEVSGASKARDVNSLKFDLVGFSEGSAVLHLAPAEVASLDAGDSPEDAQHALGPAEDAIDEALSVIADLHNAAEGAGDVLRFSGRDKLLKGFADLTRALDKHDLDMGITWRGRTGLRRTAALTSAGRDYARQFLSRVEDVDIVPISGRIVELNITGSFDVKSGNAKNSPRYTVSVGNEADLLALRLELGQSIHVRVRRKMERNHLGVSFETRYEFLDIVAASEELPSG